MAQPEAAPIRLLRPPAEFLAPELAAELEREFRQLMEAALDDIEKRVADTSMEPSVAAVSIARQYAILEARRAFHSAVATLQPLLDDMERRLAILEGKK